MIERQTLENTYFFKFENILWLSVLQCIAEKDPALLAEMADFAGVAKAEAVELVPASEKASLYASLYGKLLSPTDGGFAEKIQAVLAVNKDTYHEKITIMVEKYLKNC